MFLFFNFKCAVLHLLSTKITGKINLTESVQWKNMMPSLFDKHIYRQNVSADNQKYLCQRLQHKTKTLSLFNSESES